MKEIISKNILQSISIEQDPIAGNIVKTLNDLSVGDFDIVVADIESSITNKQNKAWLILDAIAQLQLPPTIAHDLMLNYLDIPEKDEIKKRLQETQESQAKAAQEEMQMKLQLEEIKNQNSNISISFKDLPPAAQIAVLAKRGVVPQEMADNAMQMWIQQSFPQVAEQQFEQLQQMQDLQNLPPELQMQMQSPEQKMPQEQIDQLSALQGMNQPTQNNSSPLTQPAVENLLAGISPAL